jgi:hypothetical protein
MDAETLADICNQLAEGKSLRAICQEGGICERGVYRRLRDDETFCQEYARARKTWADAQLEVVIEVARDPLKPADQKRIEIDTLKWAMGKLNGKYSDKVKHVGGDEGDPAIAVTGFDIKFV